LNTPTPPRRSGSIALFGSVLLSGLAAGALACLLALTLGRDPIWLMLPCALGIGWLMRWQGYSGTRGAIAAAVATLICIVYTQYLYAAVRMADMLGFPLRDTLFKMDLRLGWQIVHANIGLADLVVLVAAVATAIGLAVRK
jgi:hypothetical protein